VLSENAIQQGRLWGWRPGDWAAYVEPGLAPLYEAVLSACDLPPGATLLDAGCGAGGALLAALKRGIHVSGFDAATGFLAFARTRLPSTGTVELQLGDLHSIPFSDHQFDTAMAINSLQFTSDPAAAVRELARVVRRRVVIAVWHRPEDCDLRHIPNAIAALLPQPPKGRGPFELSDPGEVEALFEQAGLRTVSSNEVELVQRMDSVDHAVLGLMSAGPSSRASGLLGEDRVAAAIRGVVNERFLQPDGSVRMVNYFRCIAADVA